LNITVKSDFNFLLVHHCMGLTV